MTPKRGTITAMRTHTRFTLAATAALALTLAATTPAQAATPSQTGSFFEGFDRTAAVGQVDSLYPESWQPYPNGTSGKYYSDDIVSVHGGNMDVYFGQKKGAAGTFGTRDGSWGHVGGTFSIRAKQVGSASEGIAVMLWPTSDVWGDGEIDFPEGKLNGDAHVFHHKVSPNDPQESYGYNLGNTWGTWHTYTAVWVKGVSVKYYVDDVLKFTVTKDVPTTAHRFMFQTGNAGRGGHLIIDWVRTS